MWFYPNAICSISPCASWYLLSPWMSGIPFGVASASEMTLFKLQRYARDERSRTDGMLDTKTSERNEPPASVNSCGR